MAKVSFDNDFERASNEVKKIYGVEDYIISIATGRYRSLIKAVLKYVWHENSLEGKSLLDLGCGSLTGDNNGFEPRMYEPWFCRVVYQMEGVAIFGVDGGD